MGKRTRLVLVILLFGCWCGQSQNDSYCEARLLSVKDSSVLSFCDSIISYAQECIESPMWYKLSVNFDTDTVRFLEQQFNTWTVNTMLIICIGYRIVSLCLIPRHQMYLFILIKF